MWVTLLHSSGIHEILGWVWDGYGLQLRDVEYEIWTFMRYGDMSYGYGVHLLDGGFCAKTRSVDKTFEECGRHAYHIDMYNNRNLSSTDHDPYSSKINSAPQIMYLERALFIEDNMSLPRSHSGHGWGVITEGCLQG